jgi:hypothetical protein
MGHGKFKSDRIMKNSVFITLTVCLLFCGCSKQNYLSKSIWYNTSPAEKDGVQGTVVTSLYFVASDTVDIYSSVIVDSNLEVAPFKIAEGTYSVSGNPKKEAQVSITAVDINQKEVKYNGAYHKNKAMVLVTQDSIPKLFGKLPKTKLP